MASAMKLPKGVLVALWVLIGLGSAEIVVVVLGLLFTRDAHLLPMLVLGLADVAIPGVVLWAFKRATS
jgi:hypothetical protein